MPVGQTERYSLRRVHEAKHEESWVHHITRFQAATKCVLKACQIS